MGRCPKPRPRRGQVSRLTANQYQGSWFAEALKGHDERAALALDCCDKMRAIVISTPMEFTSANWNLVFHLSRHIS